MQKPSPATGCYFWLLLINRQKLEIPGVPCPVLLGTYFCEKQPADQSPAVDVQSIKGYHT